MDFGKYAKYSDMIVENVIVFLPKLLFAIAILIIGFWVIKRVNKVAEKGLESSNIPTELASFFLSFLDIALKGIVLLFAAGRLGFDATSLVAVIAAAGFAVGLALQGFLGNFASGITIVFFQPYKVGDWVEIGGQFGKVEQIQIFSTRLVTPSNKVLILPNGKVTDNVITNFSTKGSMLLELQLYLPYSENFQEVKKIIRESLRDLECIHHQIEPLIGIESFTEHNVLATVRPSIHPDNFWQAKFEVYEAIKTALSTNKIKVIYPEGVSLGEVGK